MDQVFKTIIEAVIAGFDSREAARHMSTLDSYVFSVINPVALRIRTNGRTFRVTVTEEDKQ